MMTFTCAQKIDFFRAWVFFTVVLPSKAILPYGNSITFETALKVLIYNQGNFESREKERRAWMPDFHTCLYVRSHFFIFFWIILNSQFYTPPTPHLAKPAQTGFDFVNILGNCALKGELKLAKFPGKEYMERWLEDEQIDIKLTSIPGKEYGKMMRSSAAKLARMDFQVVAQQEPERTLWS